MYLTPEEISLARPMKGSTSKDQLVQKYLREKETTDNIMIQITDNLLLRNHKRA